MPKLILKKDKEPVATLPIFIDITYHGHLKELSGETGIPMRRILEKMIKFSIEHMEIVENEN